METRNTGKEMVIETYKKAMMTLLVIWSGRHQRKKGKQMGSIVLKKAVICCSMSLVTSVNIKTRRGSNGS